MKKLEFPLPREHKLVRWANPISGFYGHPVYVVGSHTTGKENPRDVDIIVVIPDHEFHLRYGDVHAWIKEGETGFWTDVRWKWADDCVKKSLHGMRQTGFQIDFKTIPESYHIEGYKNIIDSFPPIKIDTRP